MKHAGVAVVLLLSLALAGAPAGAQLKTVEGITSSIEVADREISAGEPLLVKFVLSNPSGQPLHVLKWFTPFDGFTGNIFEVTTAGRRVMYIGKLVKRGPPRPDDYIRVEPGQSASISIDLLDGYAISDTGDYSLAFDSRLLDFGTEAPEAMVRKQVFQPKLIRSNLVRFRVKEVLPKSKIGLEESGGERSPDIPQFSNCTQSQVDILSQALTDAQNYAAGTQLGLVAVPTDERATSPRYTKWFGTYTAARYNTIINNFDRIYQALANETILFRCDCSENWYAYVYADEPYRIFICNAFWSAPATGTDSRMGTLIHEMSHFTVVAGTDDHAYGQSSCQSLAQNDPARAVNNADSHEYMAENTPEEPWKVSGVNHTPFALLMILLVIVAFWTYSRRRMRAPAV